MGQIQDDTDNQLSASEMYEGIDYDSNIYEDEIDGKPTTLIGMNYGNSLSSIQQFVELAISNEEPAFRRIEKKYGRTQLEPRRLGRLFPLMRSFIDSFSADFKHSEHVTLFFECCNELNLQQEYDNFCMSPMSPSYQLGRTIADIFEELIERMRAKAKQAEFKKRVRAREYNSIRNWKSAKLYQDRLFERYSRLLVIRIDFSYRIEYAEGVTAEEATKDLERFLNNRRGKPTLFAALVGYISKLEWGNEKRHHFHVIFYFDGSKVHKDDYLAFELGKYWVGITGGRGRFHNCNASKNRYKRLGIGMVRYDDIEMRNNLLLAVRYMTKKEQFLLRIGSNKRVFRRGELPSAKSSRAGRPRRRINDGEQCMERQVSSNQ